EHFGRLDVLVNNAGVPPEVRTDILDATPQSFDRLIRVNLRGPYFLTQSAAKWMIEQRRADPSFRGCVINVSSVSAIVASVNRGEYCVSKAGLSMASQLWAVRLAEFGIDVYEVRPGVIATDMTAAVKTRYDGLIAGGLTLEKRWGTPDDVGRAVAVLARGEVAIRSLARRGDLLVGAGTVLNPDTAKRAVDAGAKFLVTPGFNPKTVRWAVDHGVAIVPGTSTPTDLEMAVDHGVTVVKFFPA